MLLLPWLWIQKVSSELRGWTKGAGAGLTGLRAQSLLEMIGDNGDEAVIATFAELVQLFVDGHAPKYLRNWCSWVWGG